MRYRTGGGPHVILTIIFLDFSKDPPPFTGPLNQSQRLIQAHTGSFVTFSHILIPQRMACNLNPSFLYTDAH